MQGRAGAMSESLQLVLLIFAAATLFASVGQAGASGYLAAMGFMGLEPAVMKPAALTLNILVASIGTYRFARAGFFRWRTFYPFGVLGLPFSFAGGAVHLPTNLYYPIVGAILLFAAVMLVRATWQQAAQRMSAELKPPFLPALVSGATIGFFSGVTGTGGGVFLAPLVLLMGWVETRRTAAVSAAYNLLNSIAALAGAWATLGQLPVALPWWLVAAGVGGLVGTWFGCRILPANALRYILAAVLVIAGLRMLLVT